MEKIAILTDSCCDLSKEVINELDIKVLPFTLTIDGVDYQELKDKTSQEFYEMIDKAAEIPKHTQISPIAFTEMYKKLYDEGYTDVITVSLNSQGSGTYNNSILAKNEIYESIPEAADKMRIYNIDSKNYTLAIGYPVTEAAKMVRRGANAEEIVKYLEDCFEVIGLYTVPYNLKYAKKSGRVSAAKAFAGELLGLKPIILFADGTNDTIDKIRGEKNIAVKLADTAEKNMIPGSPYAMLHGRDDTIAKEIEKELFKRTGRKAEMYANIGGVVTANIGPDFVAVVIMRNKK